MNKILPRSLIVALAFIALAFAPGVATGPLPAAAGEPTVERVARGLGYPWGLEFLSGGRILVSERPGRLRIIGPDGTVSEPIAGLKKIAARGQGGLLGLALDPGYATNRRIYYCHAEPRGSARFGTSVSRAVLDEDGLRLKDVKVIFRQQPARRTQRHFGCRLVFDKTGALFVTLGDRGNRPEAQHGGKHIGKLVRITTDGAPAPGNPRVEGWLPEIWSIGHRNIQGAALDPLSGEIWTVEHGARGGDEINAPRAGRNYGWPVISFGRHYSGDKIGVGTRKAGMEQPVHYWDPSIAPSGMALYTGDKFPQWRGNLFVGALKSRYLSRLTMRDGKVVGEEKLLTRLNQRIRAVKQGPDGYLYVLTDSPRGQLLRLRPAS